MSQLVVALTTFPDGKSARQFATSIVDAKLAACVSMVPQAVSTYRWKGKVEETAEVLLIIKTSKAKAKLLEEVVRKSHPSELPEFVSFSAEGSAEYLAWIESETR